VCGGEGARPRVVVQRLDDLSGALCDVVDVTGDGGHQSVVNSGFSSSYQQEFGEAAEAEAAAVTITAADQEEGCVSLVGGGEKRLEPNHERVATRVNLPLLDLSLEPLMDTPTLTDTPTMMDTPSCMSTPDTPTVESLNKFLDDTDIINTDDIHHWSEDLEDLFPDLMTVV